MINQCAPNWPIITFVIIWIGLSIILTILLCNYMIVKFIWHEKLGKPECPYVIRYVLDFGLFSIRLHHWINSDDQRHMHDHEWWYASLILSGGYTDINLKGKRHLSFGSIIFNPSVHRHMVKVNKGGCWSLLLTGPHSRTFGFWVNGKFRKRNKYFFMFGHHPCE